MTRKYVLGINGWFEGSHDSSAILMEFNNDSQAKIIAGLEEEKVLGKKGVFDIFPKESAKTVIEIAGIVPEELSAIVIGWDYPLIYKTMNKKFDISSEKIISEIFPNEACLDVPLIFVNHHVAHANSAHFASTFEKSLSLVIDGNGELESTSLWKYENNTREFLESYSPISSFGFLFEATNTMLGFRENESGKTMGLAGYGKPKYVSKILDYFDNSISPSKKLKRIYNKFASANKTNLLMPYQETCIKMWRYIFEYELGIEPLKVKLSSFYEIPEDLKDLASSVQKVLEVKVLNYIDNKTKELGIRNITISGGVGLNCILNGEILELENVDNIFVQPAAGDSGVALGAAIEYGYQNNYNCNIEKFSPYIGKEYLDVEIKNFLIDNNIPFIEVSDASEKISQFIKNDEVIAVFQGRNEWGPRALGNRTILSLPSDGKLDFINKYVKCRELGRPLAPSMLVNDLDVLMNNSPKILSKYMNVAHEATKKNKGVSSIIHVDNTFRPQCVLKEENSIYFTQLEKVKENNDISILINTSFNADTPIIYNLKSAIEFMESRYIDKVVFNNKFIVSRNSVCTKI